MNNEDDYTRIKLITEQMIPIVSGDEEYKTIRIVVDGNPARCFLQDRGWNSTKIVILFDNNHPLWGDYFTTKYFDFVEPGKMRWGHEGDSIKIIQMN